MSAAETSRVTSAATIAPSITSPSAWAICTGSGNCASAHSAASRSSTIFLWAMARAHAGVGLVEFPHRIDERAAEEILPPEPLLERRPDATEPLLRGAAGTVELRKEPRAPRPALALEHRLDQAVFRAKRIVEGRLCGAGRLHYGVDPDGVDAEAAKQPGGGGEQTIARRGEGLFCLAEAPIGLGRHRQVHGAPITAQRTLRNPEERLVCLAGEGAAVPANYAHRSGI